MRINSRNKQMNPLISVIIPIYKVEQYLNECIDSVLCQTYENLEIILVDDGSPDRCGEICEEYKKKDNRITVLHKDNGGLSDARNAGLDICKGEFISFVDSDDYVSNVFIETLYNAIMKYSVDVASLYSASKFKDGTSAILTSKINKNAECNEVSKIAILDMMFYQTIPTGVQYRLYNRHIFDDLRFPKGYLFEDLATTYKIFLKVDSIALIKEDLYAYRVRENSIITDRFSQNKMVVKDITNNLYEDIISYSLELRPSAASRCFAANYSVFLQIPYVDKKDLRIIWNELIKYRQYIIKDKNKQIRKKNKIGAFVTYLGMSAAYCFGKLYLRIRND